MSVSLRRSDRQCRSGVLLMVAQHPVAACADDRPHRITYEKLTRT
jgi:hypothetical protein